MKRKTYEDLVDDSDFAWDLIQRLGELRRSLLDASDGHDLDEALGICEQISRLSNKHYSKVSKLVGRNAWLKNNLPKSGANIPLDHPIFGGKEPTRVRIVKKWSPRYVNGPAPERQETEGSQ